MRKLFISYRSSDAVKVDKIANDLGLLLDANDNPRFKTWQDKRNLQPGHPNWWDAIVDAIIDCEAFVFNLSNNSLQSEVCLAELDYANRRNRPILVVVLEGEYELNPKSGKYDLLKKTKPLVPDWLSKKQYFFSGGAGFYKDFVEAIDFFERNWPRDTKAPRPLNPDEKSIHGINHAVYHAACDYAQRLAFSDAEKHFEILRNDIDYAHVVAEWFELLRLYAELIEIDEHPNSRFIFKSKWQAYEDLFPKHFLDTIFNPKGFAKPNDSEAIAPSETKPKPAPKQVKEARQLAISKATKPASLSLMPAPFAWIEIPKKGYSIAKYPLTNLQFAEFIKAGGYTNQKWWTKDGWEARLKGWGWDGIQSKWVETRQEWAAPRYWQVSGWSGAEQPVIGVSWFEALAFCLWLSYSTGEKISLPTEEQWRYAAQSDDERAYPWGYYWDSSKCRNSVDEGYASAGNTSPVTLYEGKGDSPFGIVDMAGNVWEWCLTDEEKSSDFNNQTTSCVLRGGSWNGGHLAYFRCDNRVMRNPYFRDTYYGFRLCRTD